MQEENISYAYGFWSLVVVNAGLFVFFLLSFLTPVKKRERRSMGVMSTGSICNKLRCSYRKWGGEM